MHAEILGTPSALGDVPPGTFVSFVDQQARYGLRCTIPSTKEEHLLILSPDEKNSLGFYDVGQHPKVAAFMFSEVKLVPNASSLRMGPLDYRPFGALLLANDRTSNRMYLVGNFGARAFVDVSTGEVQLEQPKADHLAWFFGWSVACKVGDDYVTLLTFAVSQPDIAS